MYIINIDIHIVFRMFAAMSSQLPSSNKKFGHQTADLLDATSSERFFSRCSAFEGRELPWGCCGCTFAAAGDLVCLQNWNEGFAKSF